jgi:hypothetical protein
MSAAAVGTIIVTIFLVSGAAVWLIWVSITLQQVAVALDTVIDETSGITAQVAPAPGVVASVARDVGAIQSALHGLINLATAGGGPRRAPTAPTPAPERDLEEEVTSSSGPATATRPGGRRY